MGLPVSDSDQSGECQQCKGWVKQLTAFGEDDTMLCDPCWRSAFFHMIHGDRMECGNENCETCREVTR